MIQRLPLLCSVLALALLSSAACSDDTEVSRQSEDYQVIEEGSAAGVTGTLVPPNDRTGTPALTATDLDTTTTFSIVGGPTGTVTGTRDFEQGSLAEALPAGTTASRREPAAPAARPPSSAPAPSTPAPSTARETIPSAPTPSPAAPEPQPRVRTPSPESEPAPERREPEPRPEAEPEPAPPSSTTGTSTRERSEQPDPPPPPPPPPPPSEEDSPEEDPPPSTPDPDFGRDSVILS